MALFVPLSSLVRQTPGLPWTRQVEPYLNDLVKDGALRREVLALAPGASHKRDLGGGLVAIEQAYDSAPAGPQKFESHEKMIDIQMVVSGEEWMEIGPLADFTVTEPYVAERDVTFYAYHDPAARLLANAGRVAIFFPEDVHRSQICVGAPRPVRKTVIKVPVSLL
jgi:biofilm protein TabA